MARLDIIEELWAVIEDRKANPKAGSYTNKLLADEAGSGPISRR